MSDKAWKTALETSSVQVLKMRTGQASGLWPALVVVASAVVFIVVVVVVAAALCRL